MGSQTSIQLARDHWSGPERELWGWRIGWLRAAFPEPTRPIFRQTVPSPGSIPSSRCDKFGLQKAGALFDGRLRYELKATHEEI